MAFNPSRSTGLQARPRTIIAAVLATNLVLGGCSSRDNALSDKVAAGEAAAQRAETAAERAEAAAKRASGQSAPAMFEPDPDPAPDAEQDPQDDAAQDDAPADAEPAAQG